MPLAARSFQSLGHTHLVGRHAVGGLVGQDFWLEAAKISVFVGDGFGLALLE
jgi:hypothetical protein